MTGNFLLDNLINNFLYHSDKDHYGKRDHWKIIKQNSMGRYVGDCEDFALTALFMLSDKSYLKFWYYLITGKAKICYCLIRKNEGHAVLRFKGYYIDNIYRTWSDIEWLEGKKYRFDNRYFNFIQVAIQMCKSNY